MKTIMTVTGIRPDFIRMSKIFSDLDENFNHILVHTGQHYDELLSGVFFNELKIRKPDFNLNIGADGKKHYHQSADLPVKIIELIESKNIKPDLILFLGDSNSVCCAMQLKKEGFKIGHIEAGMRSGDKRMLEEINRTVCDHCSDYLFVYHDDYKENLRKENIINGVHVVGNTIVEVLRECFTNIIYNKESGDIVSKKNSHILLDVHRPENFKYKNRLNNIISFASNCQEHWGLEVKFLNFKRTTAYLEEFNIDYSQLNMVDLMSYKDFLREQYNAAFIISDSGTAQEEPAPLGTPVIVPRDFTERPQSVENGCSTMIDVNEDASIDKTKHFIKTFNPKVEWLGDGKTSEKIINILKEQL